MNLNTNVSHTFWSFHSHFLFKYALSLIISILLKYQLDVYYTF